MKKIILSTLFLFLFIPATQATTIVETTSSWNGSLGISPVGEPTMATFGQTFSVRGTENCLEKFTFFLSDYLSGDSPDYIEFEAFVMEWDGNKATGPILFKSSPLSTSNNGGESGMEAMTISTGGLNLELNKKYVAFFSTSNLFDGLNGYGNIGMVNDGDYSDGELVYSNNLDDFSSLLVTNWLSGEDDLAFLLEFESGVPVPEPSTMVLFGIGLLVFIKLSGKDYKIISA